MTVLVFKQTLIGKCTIYLHKNNKCDSKEEPLHAFFILKQPLTTLLDLRTDLTRTAASENQLENKYTGVSDSVCFELESLKEADVAIKGATHVPCYYDDVDYQIDGTVKTKRLVRPPL
jgi:hypothetical protein